MLQLEYVGENEPHNILFKKINKHVVQITGNFPVKEKGFICFRENSKEDSWDYKKYKTIYRQIECGAQFSDDGSVYAEPVKPADPEPTEPEVYVPTLEDIKAEKLSEMNMIQQNVIQEGINVTLTDGSVEHFTLTANDQISLMGLQTMITSGAEQIPWHTSDWAQHCKYYSNTDMALIVSAAMQYVSYHVTYFRDLRIYINSLENKDLVEDVTYGMAIPEEFRSDILKDMLAAMEG